MMDISKTKAYIAIERNYSYILAGIFLVSVGVGVYFMILPQYYSVRNISAATYQQSLQVLAQRQQYLDDLQVMDENYQKLDKRILSYMPKILPQLEPALLFAEIEAMFRDSKFKVQSMNIVPATTPTATSAKTLYTVTQVTVNITGEGATSYADYKELLRQFEQSAHLIELGSLSYNPGATSYTFMLKMYNL